MSVSSESDTNPAQGRASLAPSDGWTPDERAATVRLGRFVLAHRRAVMIVWLLVFLAGAMGASHVSKRLSLDFSLPGQPGYETARQIIRHYDNGGDEAPAILVVTAPAGQSVRGEQTQVAAAFGRARTSAHGVRIVDYASAHDPRLISADGRTTYAFLYTPQEHSFGAPKVAEHATRALASSLPPGSHVGLTGIAQLAEDKSGSGPGVFLETIVGGLGALAVLAFVFGSLLAFIPLVIAAVSILATLLVILALTYVANVSFIVQFLVSLVGLGVAIDYSLLIVTRWREERAHGRENHEAVVVAMATAGRAVVLSGLTVAIGLVALIVLPVPGLRSVGYGGMLIPLVSTCVALTLLPALLGGIGPRMDWPRIRHEDHASRLWTKWSSAMVRRRWAAASVAVLVLALLIAPIFKLQTGETSASALAKTGPAHAAFQQIRAGGAPSGVLTPIEVLARAPQAAAVRAQVAGLPGIADAVLSSASDSNRAGTSVILGRSAAGNGQCIDADRGQDRAQRARRPVGRDRRRRRRRDCAGLPARGLRQLPADVRGDRAADAVLLTRAFRSVTLAIKAVALNLISMAAAFGLMTWFWQEGHGSQALFNIPATGAITFWVPLMVFAFLFGLSMDYEVFILTRVREEYDRTGSTDAAVITGLGRTGRLVTSAALILFLAFASLASAPNTDIKVLATGLGAGILLDATIIRALLLPALVSLLGKWNWWFPRPVASLLRVPAGASE